MRCRMTSFVHHQTAVSDDVDCCLACRQPTRPPTRHEKFRRVAGRRWTTVKLPRAAATASCVGWLAAAHHWPSKLYEALRRRSSETVNCPAETRRPPVRLAGCWLIGRSLDIGRTEIFHDDRRQCVSNDSDVAAAVVVVVVVSLHPHR